VGSLPKSEKPREGLSAAVVLRRRCGCGVCTGLLHRRNRRQRFGVLFVASNVAFVCDFTVPANFWTAYTRGVHDRLDAFVYYGNLTIFGQTQHYFGLGSSIGILRRARHGVDVAFVNFFSTPFNRRDEAATVSGYFALSVSRPVRIGRYTPTIYSGYLRGESFGPRTDKLFSAPSGTHNGMIGSVVPLSKSLSLIAEYDPGCSQQNVGLALLYVFPKQ
jgi:hypothetical protein